MAAGGNFLISDRTLFHRLIAGKIIPVNNGNIKINSLEIHGHKILRRTCSNFKNICHNSDPISIRVSSELFHERFNSMR